MKKVTKVQEQESRERKKARKRSGGWGVIYYFYQHVKIIEQNDA